MVILPMLGNEMHSKWRKKNISANSPEKLLSNKMFETSKLYSFYKILYVQQKIQGKLVDY